MLMNRLVFAGSLACVLFLLVATYAFPTNSILWLADTSTIFSAFRVGMALVLLAVLCSAPPRHIYARLSMGILSLGLLVAGVVSCLSATTYILDTVLFFALGASLGIEALEFNEDELEQKVHTLHVEYTRRFVIVPKFMPVWDTVITTTLEENTRHSESQ
jgi:hypothetical protein